MSLSLFLPISFCFFRPLSPPPTSLLPLPFFLSLFVFIVFPFFFHRFFPLSLSFPLTSLPPPLLPSLPPSLYPSTPSFIHLFLHPFCLPFILSFFLFPLYSSLYPIPLLSFPPLRGGEKRRGGERERGREGGGEEGSHVHIRPIHSFIQFFIQAEDVKALLSDAMLHSNKTTTSVAAKPAQKNSKQASEVTPLSNANSRLLATDLTGAGDGASTERPVMELPAGKTKKSTQTFSRQNYQNIRHRPPALRQLILVVQWLAHVPFTSVTLLSLQLQDLRLGIEPATLGSFPSRRPWRCIFRNWSRLVLKTYIFLTLEVTLL